MRSLPGWIWDLLFINLGFTLLAIRKVKFGTDLFLKTGSCSLWPRSVAFSIGEIGLNYEEDDRGVLEDIPYYQAGIGGTVWDELYLAFSMGQTKDVPHSITSMEFSGEYTFDNDFVLEFSWEKEINTPNPVTTFSIGLDFWKVRDQGDLLTTNAWATSGSSNIS